MATKTSASLVKGLRLLQQIVDDKGRSSLTQIAQRMDVPLATAHRLALTLEREGFVRRGRKGYFFPGSVITRMSKGRHPKAEIAAILRRPLARLAEAYGAYTHFGVLEDGMVTYLVKERGSLNELFTEENTQLEAYCSAIGKVLLAELSPKDLDDYLGNGPFAALTKNTLTEPLAIWREVEEVRKRQCATDRYEIREDLFCIGVPVRDCRDQVVGGISISFLGKTPAASILRAAKARLKRLSQSTARFDFKIAN